MSNLLKDKYPELLNEWDYEKNILDVNKISYGSGKKVWWKCKNNHSYAKKILERTSRKRGCSICNSLAFKNSKLLKEWDYEKNNVNPKKITYASAKKVWWICKNNHSYIQSIYQKTINNSGCPYCAGSKPGYGNDLQTKFPKLVKEWDFEKNTILPSEVLPGSHKKVWWVCKKNHSYTQSIDSKTLRMSKCPYCSNKLVGYGNDLQTKFPKLVKEWDFEKNTILPSEVLPGSHKKVWWVCKKNHSYLAIIKTRARRKTGCPFCTNQKVSYENSLEAEHPKLVKEWDFEKNTILPSEVVSGSDKKVWWVCKKNHSYIARIADKTPPQERSCPYCANKLVGYGNDLKSTHPKVLKEWDYEKNKILPSEVTFGSGKKVYWKCSKNHSYFMRIADKTPPQEKSCPQCFIPSKSKEEIYLMFELKYFFDFVPSDTKTNLSKLKDVDIKIPNLMLVIEYDGEYWHRNKENNDLLKTKELEKAGWTVVRVREKPLKILSRKYNVSSKPREYKETANKVLKKLNQLGYEVKGLDKYLERKTLVNKKEAEKYIDKLLKEKSKK